MKLGILTDIHEHVDYLQTALARFRREQVDQIVVIGDVFETGDQIDETCRLLGEAKVVGVWGNHDFGLCVDPHESTLAKYPASVMDFMGTLRPRLELGGCHFMHVEPWLNPEDVADLWYFEGPPDSSEKLERIFSSVPHRIMFAGHYHKWLLAKPDGIIEWAGECPILLDEGRYFLSVGAVCEGRFALFDTDTSKLIPFNEA